MEREAGRRLEGVRLEGVRLEEKAGGRLEGGGCRG